MANEIRRRWAFLVGVNGYREPRFSSLGHCVNDVQAIAQLLRQVGYGVVCLHDQLDREAARFPDSPSTVLAELEQLCEKVGPDDLLLVYFACHGTRALVAGDPRPYLGLRDTRVRQLETALAIAAVKTVMAQSGAQRQVMLLDACHMGLGEDERGADDIEAARLFVRNVYELATGVALLTPSMAQQTTRESGMLGHGVFSHFVLSGLRGEGEALVSRTDAAQRFVTVGSLGRYVHNQLLIWSAETGYDQLPQGTWAGDLGEFILVDYRQQAFPAVLPKAQARFNASSDVDGSLASIRARDTAFAGQHCEQHCEQRCEQRCDWALGKHRQWLQAALLAVYPERVELEIFVDDCLNENLNAIADEGNLKKDVFKLIKWARAKGRLDQLYEGFCGCNADNPHVVKLRSQFGKPQDRHLSTPPEIP